MSRARFWKKPVFAIVVFAAFTIIDPFGFASVTNQASQQLTYRVLSLFQSRLAADHVAVLLIDDRSAREINGDSGYPLTFAQHATALRPVICAGPAALFIDITFRGLRGPALDDVDADPQSVIEPLLEGLSIKPSADDEYCRLPDMSRFHPSSAPRIMIGRTESHPKDKCDPLYGRPLGEECRVGKVIDRLQEVALPVSVGTIRGDGSYLLASERPGSASGMPLEPSPALAMLFAFCDAAHGSEREKLPGCRDRPALEALLDAGTAESKRQLVPSWSFYRTRARIADKAKFSPETKASQRSCSEMQDRSDAGILSKLSLASYEIWQSLFRFGHSEADSVFGTGLCNPTDTFSLLDIRQMATFCGTEGDICKERLATFFAGRMVFYGADITGINDLIETPVVGFVPGAAYHAAVAEDLLKLGADYIRMPGDLAKWTGFPINTSQLVDIGVFTVVAFVLAMFFQLSSAAASSQVAVSHTNVAGLVIFASALIVAIVSLCLAFVAGLQTFTLVVAIVTLAMLVWGGKKFAFPNAGGIDRMARISIALPLALYIAIALSIIAYAFFLLPPSNIIATAMFAGALAFDN